MCKSQADITNEAMELFNKYLKDAVDIHNRSIQQKISNDVMRNVNFNIATSFSNEDNDRRKQREREIGLELARRINQDANVNFQIEFVNDTFSFRFLVS